MSIRKPRSNRHRYDPESQSQSHAHETRWTDPGSPYMAHVVSVSIVQTGPGAGWGRRPRGRR